MRRIQQHKMNPTRMNSIRTKNTNWIELSGALNLLRTRGIYVVLAALLILASLLTEHFFTVRNLTNVANQATFLGIVSLGQLLTLLVGGFDLSVGSECDNKQGNPETCAHKAVNKTGC